MFLGNGTVLVVFEGEKEYALPNRDRDDRDNGTLQGSAPVRGSPIMRCSAINGSVKMRHGRLSGQTLTVLFQIMRAGRGRASLRAEGKRAERSGCPCNIRELGMLSVNFRALSDPVRAHCCLTNEHFQNATGQAVRESVMLRQP